MPIILLPVPDPIESITRPVVFDVVRQLMEITGLSSKTNMSFPGDTEKTKQLGSSISSHGDDPNKFAYDEKISIEIEEIYNPDRLINEAVYGPQNLLIFEDVLLKLVMKPVYSGTDLNISVKYRAANRTAALRWRDMIKMRMGQFRDINMHDLTYHYAIPPEMLYILKEIHTMRETVAPYGDSYEKYFKEHATPIITELTNMNGSAKVIAVPEVQMQVQGWFDFEVPDAGSKEDESEAWYTSFTYKLRYDRPIGVVMTYPLIVHNQVLPQKLREKPVPTEDDVLKSYSQSVRVLNHFYQGRQVADYVHRVGYSIPTYDEWLPKSVPNDTIRLLTLLITIDAANPTLFLNLRDLGQKKFSSEILVWMMEEAQYLTRPYASPMMVTFYRNEFQIGPTPLRINANLDVIATTPIMLRDEHHIRISIVTDLTMLPEVAIARLRKHGTAALQILEVIDPTLIDRGFMPKVQKGNYITRADMINAIDHIRPMKPHGNWLMLQQTVQKFFIQAQPHL
jgi:hypothetical protein